MFASSVCPFRAQGRMWSASGSCPSERLHQGQHPSWVTQAMRRIPVGKKRPSVLLMFDLLSFGMGGSQGGRLFAGDPALALFVFGGEDVLLRPSGRQRGLVARRTLAGHADPLGQRCWT